MTLILTAVMMIFIVLSNGGVLELYAGEEDCDAGPIQVEANACTDQSSFTDCGAFVRCECIGLNQIKKIVVDYYLDPDCLGDPAGHAEVAATDECEETDGECGEDSWTVYVKIFEDDWDEACGSCP
eukprot:UN07475